MSKKKPLKKRTKSRKVNRKFLKFLTTFGAWATFFVVIFILYCIYDLPNIDDLDLRIEKSYAIKIKDTKNQTLSIYGNIHGKKVSYNRLPKNLVNAVISIEDRKFFSHNGADYFGILRAFISNKLAGRVVQGGSTITQQLAKIIFLSPKKTIKRKIQEIILSYKLEGMLFKEHILSLYLNNVYLGQGVYGVEAAASYYFNKDVSRLTLFESAMLAGMLKAPSKFSPFNDNKLSVQRAKLVLSAMEDEQYISHKQRIKATPPILKETKNMRGILENPYFSDYVLEQVQELIGEATEDIDVYTTIDMGIQKSLMIAVQDGIKQSQELNVTQGAAISINTNGAIKAMVGGVDYHESKFNRAVHALRQSGSIFKLFVYLSALEKGAKTTDYVEDKPINIKGWSPQNYTKKYHGNITVENAFIKSINTASVRIAEKYGRKNIIDLAYKLGLSQSIPNFPSISLGTVDTTLLELTNSFAIIANNGYKVAPYAIIKITTKSGKTLYQKQTTNKPQLLNHYSVSNMKHLLKSTVTHGTGKNAYINGKTIYAKTGTTQNYKDAWFIGFDDNSLTTGVWVGNDDNKSMDKITGGKLPALIWKDFYKNQ
jgi:penicillin-binding protein 1A